MFRVVIQNSFFSGKTYTRCITCDSVGYCPRGRGGEDAPTRQFGLKEGIGSGYSYGTYRAGPHPTSDVVSLLDTPTETTPTFDSWGPYTAPERKSRV